MADDPTGPPGPAVSVEIVGAASTFLGGTMPFEIVVRNAGRAPAAQVRVEVPLPVGARARVAEPPAEALGDRLSWSLGNLEAGAERRLRGEIQPGNVGEVLLTPTVTFAAANGLRGRVVKPPISVSVSGPETAALNAPVVFEIRITNDTAAAVRQVVVHDQLPPGLKYEKGSSIEADLGLLGPGETRTLSLQVQAVSVGRMVNQVTVRAEGGMHAEAAAAVQVSEVGLALFLKTPRQAQAPRDLDGQLEIQNRGPVPANAVRLSQEVPPGFEFVEASTGGVFNPARRSIDWSLAGVAGGQTQTVTFRLKPRTSGDWALQATAVAERLPAVRESHPVHVEVPVPSLLVEVAPHKDPIDTGAETVYEVRVLNPGEVPATNLRLRVAVPENLAPLNAEGPTTAAGQQPIVFGPLPQLAPHTDAVYRVRVRGQQPGDGQFRVELTAEGLVRPLYGECTAHVRGSASSGSPTTPVLGVPIGMTPAGFPGPGG
jgi:uncharacterized repeat protein (TIGR01451 family)